MIIKSKNFILRPYDKKDAMCLFENFNDRKVTQFMSGAKCPYTLSDAKKWIDYCKKSEGKKPRKDMIFVIEKGAKFAGSISLRKIKGHKAELSYWLGRKYWNKGIITEAIGVTTGFGFNKLKLKRIYAYVFKKNKNSARVLEKNGFKAEGLLRKDRIKDGKFIDVYVYAKLN